MPPRKQASEGTRRKTYNKRASSSLAVKKKHVRELAKANQWDEIKSIYGETMLKKAKEYANKSRRKGFGNKTSERVGSEKVFERKTSAVSSPTFVASPSPPRVMVTPQMLARQILQMNGYEDPSPAVDQSKKSTAKPQKSSKNLNSVPPIPVTKYSSQIIEKPGAIVIPESPEELTDEQKNRIEQKRRDAMRKREQHKILTSQHAAKVKPVVILPNHTKTIDDITRQELEFAARMTDWDLELPPDPPTFRAEVVTPPTPNQGNRTKAAVSMSDRKIIDSIRCEGKKKVDYSVSQSNRHFPHAECENHDNTNTSRFPSASIAEELAAAADIAEWECRYLAETASNTAQSDRFTERKEFDATTKIPQSQSTALSGGNVHPTLISSDNINTLEGFIEKYFLDEKVDLSVLDFVDTILA